MATTNNNFSAFTKFSPDIGQNSDIRVSQDPSIVPGFGSDVDVKEVYLLTQYGEKVDYAARLVKTILKELANGSHTAFAVLDRTPKRHPMVELVTLGSLIEKKKGFKFLITLKVATET
jgi:hypothetical protein